MLTRKPNLKDKILGQALKVEALKAEKREVKKVKRIIVKNLKVGAKTKKNK